jgi:SP family general alpha glucoside:H+ symporter-like MFS transporter
MIVITNEVEKTLESGVSYLDCFKGSDLRRTEVVCGTWSIQCLCGSTIMGYSTYFYIQAGLPTVYAFDMSMAQVNLEPSPYNLQSNNLQYALGAIGTVCSWFLMSYMGRRTIYVYGLAILTTLLLLIGLTSLSNSTATSWAIGSLLLAFTFIYDATIGPVCYSLVSELPSTRLKTKSIVLARCAYNIFGIVNGVITPYMLNPTAWNWKGRSGFFWAGLCFLCALWSYFRLPEPKGRTYGELDTLFEMGISARAFRRTNVSVWQSNIFDTVDSDDKEKESVEAAAGQG